MLLKLADKNPQMLLKLAADNGQSKKRKRLVDGEGNKIESSSNVSATLKKDTKAQVSTVTFASKKYPYVDENQRPLKIYEVVYNYDILCRNREKLLFPQTSKKM